MKTYLLIGVFLTAPTCLMSFQSTILNVDALTNNFHSEEKTPEEYDKGYKEGYCDGWKDARNDPHGVQGCPPPPFINNQPYIDGFRTEKDGYKAGFKHGLKDGNKYPQ